MQQINIDTLSKDELVQYLQNWWKFNSVIYTMSWDNVIYEPTKIESAEGYIEYTRKLLEEISLHLNIK